MINNKLSEAKSLWDLDDYDRDLTMFTITNLTLSREENRNVVNMALKLKRKVSTELLTTYFPTILLLQKNGITDACSTEDCCPLLTICPRCCPRHAPR